MQKEKKLKIFSEIHFIFLWLNLVLVGDGVSYNYLVCSILKILQTKLLKWYVFLIFICTVFWINIYKSEVRRAIKNIIWYFTRSKSSSISSNFQFLVNMGKTGLENKFYLFVSEKMTWIKVESGKVSFHLRQF